MKESIKEKAGVLNGNQRQNFTLAKTIVGDPKLLILDKPTSCLSPKVANTIIHILCRYY